MAITAGFWKFVPAFGRVEVEKKIVAYISGSEVESEAISNGLLVSAAPELKEACDLARTEFIGLAAYLGTCAEDVIAANLRSTIASLEGKVEVLSRAIRKAEGETA